MEQAFFMCDDKHNRVMSNTNFVGHIGSVVESANGQGFTLTSEQLIEFMKKVINAVLEV